MDIVLNEVPRTIKGLRRALFDEINGLRTGKTNTSRAMTIHKLATQIIELTKLEVNYAATISAQAKQIGAKLD